MKFKSILLAAAGLLALAGAVNPPISPQDVARGIVSIPDLNSCTLHCNLPWKKCVMECRGGSSCERRCNCDLFSDQKQICRLRKCVRTPTECLAIKRDVQEPSLVNLCVLRKAVVESCVRACGGGKGCELSCESNLTGSNPLCAQCGSVHCGIDTNDTTVQGRSEGNEPTHEDSYTASAVVRGVPPPQNPCVICQFGINACKKECATPGACDDTCNCYAQLHNRSCKDCQLPACECGHTCPRLEPLQRRLAVPDVAQGATKQASVTTSAVGPCLGCQHSILACKNNCANSGACDDSCNCYAKLYNRKCKGCKLPACDCGHTCPRLEPIQRRLAVSGDSLETSVVARQSPLLPPWPLPPTTPCVVCQYSINACYEGCKGSTCKDTCRCYAKLHNNNCKNCKLDCKCVHTCPRLEPIQRRLAISGVTEDICDTSDALSIEDGAVTIPNPCVVCRTGIKLCKNKCDGDHACEDNCNCYYKLHTLNCKECSILCKCGNNCPRVALRNDTVQLIDSTEDASSTDDGSEVQSGIGVPISPGNTCLKALNNCKAACATRGACDDTCNCYYRNHRDCKSVKIPECKCGHTCPTLPRH